MRAVKLPAQVNKDHTLHLQLPDEIGEGPAEVIVLVPESTAGAHSQPEEASLGDFLARPRVDSRFIRSKEEIDDYLREERESWE
ncbi:MAG: hypothetical protein GY722_18170 [bacterium]|nr:hypothetical protein [bacterium]